MLGHSFVIIIVVIVCIEQISKEILNSCLFVITPFIALHNGHVRAASAIFVRKHLQCEHALQKCIRVSMTGACAGYFNTIIPKSLVRQDRNKYQLSLTNPRDALHHGEHAANK